MDSFTVPPLLPPEPAYVMSFSRGLWSLTRCGRPMSRSRDEGRVRAFATRHLAAETIRRGRPVGCRRLGVDGTATDHWFVPEGHLEPAALAAEGGGL